jgi:hypothetical protein
MGESKVDGTTVTTFHAGLLQSKEYEKLRTRTRGYSPFDYILGKSVSAI